MTWGVRILPRVDLGHCDAELLDERGRMRLLSFEAIQRLPPDALATWCLARARYNVVTSELVAFVRGLITKAGFELADCLEVGAGMGDLGRHLGIRMTDSAMQTRPDIRLYYQTLGQPIVDPPADVERIDGIGALEKHKPRVVVAAWVTQLYREGDTEARIGSSVEGVDEERLVRDVELYVHIGNDGPHGTKRILAREHTCVRAPWIVSRGLDQSKNCIRIWRKGEGNR